MVPLIGASSLHAKAFLAMDLVPKLLRGVHRLQPNPAVAESLVGSAPIPSPLQSGGLSYRQGHKVGMAVLRQAEAAGVRVLTLAVVGHGAMIRRHCLAQATDLENAARNCTSGADGRIEPQVEGLLKPFPKAAWGLGELGNKSKLFRAFVLHIFDLHHAPSRL